MVPSPCVPGGTDAGRNEQQCEKDRNSAEAISDDSTSRFVLRYLLFHSGLPDLHQYRSRRLLILSVPNERLCKDVRNDTQSSIANTGNALTHGVAVGWRANPDITRFSAYVWLRDHSAIMRGLNRI